MPMVFPFPSWESVTVTKAARDVEKTSHSSH
jgi:hypothetical protein